MKKILLIIVLLLTLVGGMANAATYYQGQTITGKTTEGVSIKAEVLNVSAKTCRLTYQCVSTSTTGKVTVPSYIEGFKVVEAGEGWSGAFEDCKSITTMKLPPAQPPENRKGAPVRGRLSANRLASALRTPSSRSEASSRCRCRSR